MAYFPFKTFVATWEFLTRATYFSILKSNVNLKQSPAISFNLYRMDFVLVLSLHLSDWFKNISKMKTRICPKLCYLNLSDQPKSSQFKSSQVKKKLLFKMTYFSPWNAKKAKHPSSCRWQHEKIPTVTKARAWCHAARAAYSPNSMFFSICAFLLRDFVQDCTFHMIPE